MTTAAFYTAVRPLFGGTLSQSQVDGLNVILAASQDLDIAERAYLLATAHHETGRTMQPVREEFGRTDDQSISRLETAWRNGKLKSVKTPYWRKDKDGKSWFGRGYVQLTHKYNYERASALTGIDLVANPSAAMRPDVAAKILVQGSVNGMFTGRKLGEFVGGSKRDYAGARRVINGTDKAQLIAGYARSYEAALRHVPVSLPVPDVEPTPAPQPKPTPAPAQTTGLWAALQSAFARLFRS